MSVVNGIESFMKAFLVEPNTKSTIINLFGWVKT